LATFECHVALAYRPNTAHRELASIHLGVQSER
jgi:hypothetical protein